MSGFGKVFRRNKLALLGLVLTVAWVTAGVVAPWVAPYDPTREDLSLRLKPPSWEHLLGTDDVGRDVLSRILFGARISLTIAGASVAIGLMVGSILGSIGGYYGGVADLVVMRVVDVLLSIPSIILAVAVVSILQAGVPSVIIAVGVTSIPVYARLVRGVVLTLRQLDYVYAAQAVGCGDLRVVVRHLLPNALGPIAVQATLGAGTAIMVAAALSFLGLGVQPPAPEWGAMLSRGREYMTVAPHVVAFPGLAISMLVLGFNLLGDGLRDLLDPRLRGLD